MIEWIHTHPIEIVGVLAAGMILLRITWELWR